MLYIGEAAEAETWAKALPLTVDDFKNGRGLHASGRYTCTAPWRQ